VVHRRLRRVGPPSWAAGGGTGGVRVSRPEDTQTGHADWAIGGGSCNRRPRQDRSALPRLSPAGYGLGPRYLRRYTSATAARPSSVDRTLATRLEPPAPPQSQRGPRRGCLSGRVANAGLVLERKLEPAFVNGDKGTFAPGHRQFAHQRRQVHSVGLAYHALRRTIGPYGPGSNR
jgi:hypothetical protein